MSPLPLWRKLSLRLLPPLLNSFFTVRAEERTVPASLLRDVQNIFDFASCTPEVWIEDGEEQGSGRVEDEMGFCRGV